MKYSSTLPHRLRFAVYFAFILPLLALAPGANASTLILDGDTGAWSFTLGASEELYLDSSAALWGDTSGLLATQTAAFTSIEGPLGTATVFLDSGALVGFQLAFTGIVSSPLTALTINSPTAFGGGFTAPDDENFASNPVLSSNQPLAVNPAVPEPTSTGLIALAGLAWMVRRRA